MVDKLMALTLQRPIVDENGALNSESRVFFSNLAERLPIYGDGSPEGVVEAGRGREYYDLQGGTGSIIYVKTAANIDGDRTRGWVLA